MSDIDGIFDAIENEERGVEVPPKEAPAETEAPKEEPESTTEPSEEVETPPAEEAKTEEATTTEEGTDAKAEEPETKTEPSQETETKTEAEAEVDWKATLPPPPPDYNGPKPEIDPETGQVTNMGPEEYAQYLRETTKAEVRQEAYGNYVENAALDAAEKILPQIKTSPAVRALVENARVASVINGQQIDTYEAAKQVREALGIAPEQLQQAKAEGIQSAKTSITIQKRAAVETGATEKKAEPSQYDALKPRLQAQDDDAFAELLTLWEKEGKI